MIKPHSMDRVAPIGVMPARHPARCDSSLPGRQARVLRRVGALLLAATVTGCAVPSASAQSTKPDAGQAALSPADQAFKAAFDAQSRKNLEAFDEAAAKVPASHVLYDYIPYWHLRLKMNLLAREREREDDEQSDPSAQAGDEPAGGEQSVAATEKPDTGNDPALDESVRAFIAGAPASLTADLLRKKWMLELGRRGEWAELLTHLPLWIRRNDTRVFCQAGRARLALGKAVGEQTIDAFNRDRNLDEECGPFARELLAANVLDRQNLRVRKWRALEVRDWRSARLLAEILGNTEQDARRALEKSADLLTAVQTQLGGGQGKADAGLQFLAGVTSDSNGKVSLNDQQRDLLLMALVRQSRPKPVETAERMAFFEPYLRQHEAQFIWAQIAASAMRDMIPEAYQYTLKAGAAPVSDYTRVWLARASLRQKDWPTLTRIIGQMSSSMQASPTWQYWRARALDAQGARFGAQALLKKISGRHHFYGELAAEELGTLVAAPESAPPPSAAAVKRVASLPGFTRARKFYELGIRYQGNREWNFQTRAMNDDQLLASAHFACQKQLFERCVGTAVRTREKHDYSLRFISPYRGELTAMAQARGLDPAWVFGLIRQESRFTDDARSSAGARGLMQIMPATGRWIAQQMGVRGFRTNDLYERNTNVKFGTYYLKSVYDDLHSSPLLASAAYNAGPKRPRRWMSTLPADVDGALFVEIIPFAQTRNYVKKVLLNTAYYASVFSGEPQSLKSLLGQVPLTPYETTRIP